MNKCIICGSDKGVRNSKLIGMVCGKHYMQYKRYGKILENTRFDKNVVFDYNGDIKIIVLKDNDFNIVGHVKVDASMADVVKDYKWNLSVYGYAKNANEKLYLHRIILGLTDKNIIVDHLNKDRLDNRLVNLRICTKKENAENSKLAHTNTSGFTGVSYNKNANKWEAYASHKYLGIYSTKEEAIEIRDNYELKNYEHRNIHIPQTIEI